MTVLTTKGINTAWAHIDVPAEAAVVKRRKNDAMVYK